MQFGLAVNKGYGEHEKPNFFSCVLYGEAAQRLTDAGVKKGSLITITGDLELETFKRNDGSEGWRAKVTLYDWRYAHTSKPKNTPENTPESDESNEKECIYHKLPYFAARNPCDCIVSTKETRTDCYFNSVWSLGTLFADP